MDSDNLDRIMNSLPINKEKYILVNAPEMTTSISGSNFYLINNMINKSYYKIKKNNDIVVSIEKIKITTKENIDEINNILTKNYKLVKLLYKKESFDTMIEQLETYKSNIKNINDTLNPNNTLPHKVQVKVVGSSGVCKTVQDNEQLNKYLSQYLGENSIINSNDYINIFATYSRLLNNILSNINASMLGIIECIKNGFYTVSNIEMNNITKKFNQYLEPFLKEIRIFNIPIKVENKEIFKKISNYFLYISGYLNDLNTIGYFLYYNKIVYDKISNNTSSLNFTLELIEQILKLLTNIDVYLTPLTSETADKPPRRHIFDLVYDDGPTDDIIDAIGKFDISNHLTEYSNFYKIRMQKFNWNIENDVINISLIRHAFINDLELIKSKLDCNINYNDYGYDWIANQCWFDTACWCIFSENKVINKLMLEEYYTKHIKPIWRKIFNILINSFYNGNHNLIYKDMILKKICNNQNIVIFNLFNINYNTGGYEDRAVSKILQLFFGLTKTKHNCTPNRSFLMRIEMYIYKTADNKPIIIRIKFGEKDSNTLYPINSGIINITTFLYSIQHTLNFSGTGLTLEKIFSEYEPYAISRAYTGHATAFSKCINSDKWIHYNDNHNGLTHNIVEANTSEVILGLNVRTNIFFYHKSNI